MHKFTKTSIFYVRANPLAKLRLIFFSYAGGSASIFHSYNMLISSEVEIVAIQLPGHGDRFKESLITDWSEMKELIRSEISLLCNKPYILFGHSFGAQLAFEFSLHQTILANPPLHAFFSGAKAPYLEKSSSPIHHLPDQEFIEKLVAMGGTPKIVSENNELMQILLPMLRADFKLSHLHKVEAKCYFNFPATILYGNRDNFTSLNAIQAWQHLFSLPININCVDGDHYYINNNRERVASYINEVIENILIDKLC